MGETTAPPAVGMLALDTRRGCIGLVMDVQQSRVWLRPRGGGREWEARCSEVEPAKASDLLRDDVAAANRISRAQP